MHQSKDRLPKDIPMSAPASSPSPRRPDLLSHSQSLRIELFLRRRIWREIIIGLGGGGSGGGGVDLCRRGSGSIDGGGGGSSSDIKGRGRRLLAHHFEGKLLKVRLGYRHTSNARISRIICW